MANGYNATLGGDGKQLYDYDVIAEKYLELQNMTEVAKKLNISTDTVSFVVHIRNLKIKTSQEINIEKYSVPVNCFSKETGELLHEFKSFADAAYFISIERDLPLEKLKTSGTIRHHICDNCNGKRLSAYGYIWKYKN